MRSEEFLCLRLGSSFSALIAVPASMILIAGMWVAVLSGLPGTGQIRVALVVLSALLPAALAVVVVTYSKYIARHPMVSLKGDQLALREPSVLKGDLVLNVHDIEVEVYEQGSVGALLCGLAVGPVAYNILIRLPRPAVLPVRRGLFGAHSITWALWDVVPTKIPCPDWNRRYREIVIGVDGSGSQLVNMVNRAKGAL